MAPDGGDFQERITKALSMPESAQRFLYVYWLAATEWLKRSAKESANPVPPPRKGEDLSEWMRKAQGYISKTEGLMLQLRRVESYLGHAPKKIDPRVLEDAKCLTAVRWIRAAAQNGESDEEIASWLRNYLTPSTKGKSGRPAGSMDYDGHVLLALVLHESSPCIWTFPKLADKLLGCKSHKRHTADSDCVDKLKKAVARLRAFLQELGYKPTGK